RPRLRRRRIEELAVFEHVMNSERIADEISARGERDARRQREIPLGEQEAVHGVILRRTRALRERRRRYDEDAVTRHLRALHLAAKSTGDIDRADLGRIAERAPSAKIELRRVREAVREWLITESA